MKETFRNDLETCRVSFRLNISEESFEYRETFIQFVRAVYKCFEKCIFKHNGTLIKQKDSTLLRTF